MFMWKMEIVQNKSYCGFETCLVKSRNNGIHFAAGVWVGQTAGVRLVVGSFTMAINPLGALKQA